MPAPLAPIAWTALRVGAVAAVALYTARRRRSAPPDAMRNAALNEAPDGVEITTHRQRDQAAAHGSARLRRTVRLGRNGPGVELDIGALGRVRLRRA